MAQHYLAIDLGAGSGRVMLGTIADNQITLQEMHRFANEPVKIAGTLVWDLPQLWNNILVGLTKGISQQPDISGIAVDTWGVDFGLLDGRGQLLANPVCYRDSRTDTLPEQVFARIAKERVFAITGLQTMSLNTLFQLASMSLRQDSILGVARRLLFMPDLIGYLLTGRMSNEYSISSTSQLLDAKTRNWSGEILDAIGAPRHLFSTPVAPATPQSLLGPVSTEVGQIIGKAGIPVWQVGGHDTASAVAGVPAVDNDWLYLSSGTWSLLGTEADEPVLTQVVQDANITNEGGVGGKIRLLKNITGMWLIQECKRQWAQEGRDVDYSTLDKLTTEAPANTAKLDLFNEPSFGQPGQMCDKIAAYCQRTGQRVPTNQGEFARVIFESLAQCYAEVIQILKNVTGRNFGQLHIVGGGSKNLLLNQLAANATGLKVLAGPVEATALGNVIGQAIASGHMASLTAGRQLIANSVQPQICVPQ
ncbi:MAG: rhamnulokinase family protein [Phycisphaerae bacterium]